MVGIFFVIRHQFFVLTHEKVLRTKLKFTFVPEKWINDKTKNMKNRLLFSMMLLVAIAFADAAQAQQVGERLPMEQVYKRKYTATKIENIEHHVDGRDDEAEWD